jgi:hypothetical protein
MIGPLVGGLLANPVSLYPTVFGGNRFLTAFPWVMPNLVVGAFLVVGWTVGILFLEVWIVSKPLSRLTPKLNASRKRLKHLRITATMAFGLDVTFLPYSTFGRAHVLRIILFYQKRRSVPTILTKQNLRIPIAKGIVILILPWLARRRQSIAYLPHNPASISWSMHFSLLTA